jgi:hypothetical protein
MGIVPLQFLEGENADSLGLSGKEKYTIKIPQDIRPLQELTVEVRHGYFILQDQLCICALKIIPETRYFIHWKLKFGYSSVSGIIEYAFLKHYLFMYFTRMTILC